MNLYTAHDHLRRFSLTKPPSITTDQHADDGDTTAPKKSPRPSPTTWLDEHGDYLFSYALARVRNRHVAEDLVQDTLLAGVESYERYESRSSVRTWLTAILRHKIVDHYRRTSLAGDAQPRGSRMAPVSSEAALKRAVDAQFDRRGVWKVLPRAWDEREGDPSRSLESEEFRRVLMECLEHLPPKSAEVVDLAERQDMSLKQISMVLEMTTSNVGVMLFRARAALRRCLELRWFRDW